MKSLRVMAIGRMATGAENISSSGDTLNTITSELAETIGRITKEIGQFKV